MKNWILQVAAKMKAYSFSLPTQVYYKITVEWRRASIMSSAQTLIYIRMNLYVMEVLWFCIPFMILNKFVYNY